MLQESTLFLNNISQIDFAYLNPLAALPIGGSYHLSALVTGDVEPQEAVVVDFGKIKKSIKEIVDAKEDGFDHKLWVPSNYDCKLYNRTFSMKVDASEIEIITDNFSTICPIDSVKMVDSSLSFEQQISCQLEHKLNVLYPTTNIKVKANLSVKAFIPEQIGPFFRYFRYVHGLKNSSSWGCQNISHGHLSWLAVCDKDGNGIELPNELFFEITDKLNNAVFIWSENVIDKNQGIVSIGYDCDRGSFEAKYSKNVNVIEIDTETTVENLAEWFIVTFKERLTTDFFKKRGAYSVYFSEGLAKGCYIQI
jgi:6-pyruvoyl-tetrahydropterin synthase